jgi:thiamine biosynthesis lipoprotein
MRRRRLLAITAAAAVASTLPARVTPMTQWRGVALGADATITLAHPDGGRIVDRALAEIARMEAVFSLHRADSALARLNAEGRLDAPPFELLECLGLAARVHRRPAGPSTRPCNRSGHCTRRTTPAAPMRIPPRPMRWPRRAPAQAGIGCAWTPGQSAWTPEWR